MPNGELLIINTLKVYQQVFANISVVVREDDHALISTLANQQIICLLNSNAEQGLSQSIVTAVNQLDASDAYLIVLADMPYVAINTIKAIADRACSEKIIIPRSDSKNGNPICIGNKFRQNLLCLSGDVGAKNLIQANPGSLEYLDCHDDGIHHDIDRLSDIRVS